MKFLAPEVLLGGGYGKEVDLWGIGIILYICKYFHIVFLNVHSVIWNSSFW